MEFARSVVALRRVDEDTWPLRRGALPGLVDLRCLPDQLLLVLAGFAGLAGEPGGAGDNNGGASPPHFLNPLIAQGVSKGGERVNLGTE